MHPFDAILRTNPGYVEDLLRAYEQDPASVPPSWAAFFAGWEMGLREGASSATASAPGPATAPSAAVSLPLGPDGSPILLTADGGLPEGVHASWLPSLPVYDLVHSYREYGHLVADIDPLGRSPRTHPLLDMSEFGISEADLARPAKCATFKAFREGTIGEFLQALRETYCEHVAVEFIDEVEKEQRDWLTDAMEPSRNKAPLDAAARRDLLEQLVVADSFEEALGRAFPGGKRFSLEGGTTLVPLLNELWQRGAESGVEQVVMGMAHRGRLNVLANVLGKPLQYILAEFEGRPLPPEVAGYGDVKYHLGWTGRHRARNGAEIELTLEFNPSHLEAVNPVVEGIVRARQNLLGDAERRRVVPVLMHGDAAVAGQGVVAETLLLAGLKSYTTGGTIHVVVNNQVGFTTDPDEARPTRYCTEIAKMAKAPIFHVNGDDPEACVQVARLAMDYRQRFRSDVVIDLVCYRRHGHNELDDPTFTQPVMYKLVKAHPSNSRVYAARLAEEGVATEGDVEAMASAFQARFDEAHAAGKALPHQHVEKPGVAWEGLGPAGSDWSAKTSVPRPTLERIAQALTRVPDGFTWHPRLKRLMQQRADMVLKDQPMDWGCAEAMAVGSLVVEGTKVRLTGQDAGRGTFSHRHAVYVDAETGERHVPLCHVQPDQKSFMIVNSPLSEEAVLGFEYGYSTADPWTLNCWEAQFGDFANGAQVVIDQLLASAEFKWGRRSGLVLLLPHGYEGQGPEHSSARLERFLELCAEGNMQVCNLTTPAQYFHALRRQMRRDFRKPLVIMTPKSLLRHELAVSRVSELVEGTFRTFIDDEALRDRTAIDRLIVCSGKVYWTLVQSRQARWAKGEAHDVAIARVEQLYPFPVRELRDALASYPNLSQVTWAQEEPRNMGAWRHVRHCLEQALPPGARLAYAGRHSAAVPATGSGEVHAREERELVEAAFAPEGGVVAGERLLARRQAEAAPPPATPQAASAAAATSRPRERRS